MVLLVVNLQVSELVEESESDLDVKHHVTDFFSEIWKVGKVRFYVIFQVYSSTATNLYTILLARFCNFFNCT